MSLLDKPLRWFSGNKFAQRLLERNVRKSLLLMGVGSGDDVETSGEAVVLEHLLKNRKESYCIFDVGANQGQYLNILQQKISAKNVFIHCFEPSAKTFQLLRDNVKESNAVFLNNIAFGKEQGSTTLFTNETGSGLASLTKRKLDHFDITFDQSEEVKIDTLDNYCKLHEVDRIDLLKLDVEGHELDVLAGATNMIGKKAIGMVVFEFGGCNIDTRTFFRDFYHFFSDHKMKILRVTPKGYLHQINNYKELYEQFTTTNFVAVRN